MADAEEPQFHSLKDRIAALNKQPTFKPAEPVRKPSAPAVPSRPSPSPAHANGSPSPSPVPPPRPARAAPPPLPRRDTGASQSSQNGAGPTPTPPARPAIPARKSTQHLSERRGSTSSELSVRSTGSAGGRRLPPTLGEAKLPPLPPTRRELEAQAQAEGSRPTQPRAPVPTPQRNGSTSTPATQAPGGKPSLPPRLPSRPAKSPAAAKETEAEAAQEERPAQRPHAPLKSNSFVGFGDTAGKQPPRKNGAVNGFGSGNRGTQPSPGPWRNGADHAKSPPIPQRPRDDEPPPIPVASRPTVAQIEAVKARGASTGTPPGGERADCFICRDWRRPDHLATQFPLATLPRNDPVGHLARGLCDPLPSYTDKARAIFTWFHHNIAYDTGAFFSKNLKHRSPEETIFSGLAVCEGYAVVYAAIAKRAGLECVVISGHGKGFGYKPLAPGERPPPAKPDGHAWNAVRIDGGGWKLLDACWGAGNVDGATQSYNKVFAANHFEAPNDVFALKHFPKEAKHQFRDDGRVMGWDEYYLGPFGGDGPEIFGGDVDFLVPSLAPRQKRIRVGSGEVVRFQFSRTCEHAKNFRDKSVVFILLTKGGPRGDSVAFETDGYWFWLDMHARDLGPPGESITLGYVTSIDGEDVKGLTRDEYLDKKNRYAMCFGVVAGWDLI